MNYKYGFIIQKKEEKILKIIAERYVQKNGETKEDEKDLMDIEDNARIGEDYEE